ncbi:MAG: hypothetical protein HZB38_16910 [Planctomycetes bacterium]|nr:hypothetical protein [Planctomycetota bacterium]
MSNTYNRGRLWPAVIASAFALGLVAPAHGIQVLWQANNAGVQIGFTFNEVEFENPLSGQETIGGYRIAQWRDADYRAGSPPWYDDWTVNSPGIDGWPTEIWLRQQGHAASTSTTIPSTDVSIHLTGDDNDGLAEVLVDGVLVARLDMGTPQPGQRAVVFVSMLANTTHMITVQDAGIGPSGFGDDVAILGACALRRDLKWDQPPVPGEPDNVFMGWNELSEFGGSRIAADDWVCETTDPVSDIHWWGSFLNWREGYAPAILPAYFHMTIWTDVPFMPPGFSHPGQVLWEYDCFDYTVEFAGWDFDPRSREYESGFRFNCNLPQSAWFYQDPGQHIYWLSIAAAYPSGGGDYPFGWKTKPRDPTSPAPDAAVRIFDPTAPHPGMLWGMGEPITWPDEQSRWDLAFELTTKRQAPGFDFKWDQPPVPNPDMPPCFMGWDEVSNWQMPPIVADDWVCLDQRPVTDIHWWGSYRNWDQPAPPGARPVAFHIGVWTDVPAGPEPFSHPGVMLWQWLVPIDQVAETYVGCDFFPPFTPIPESCFLYTYNIPQPEWFYQEMPGTIFWLSISAIYPACRCGGDGDLDDNGIVDLADLNFVANCVGMPPIGACAQADVNCDSLIDLADLQVVLCLMGGPPDPPCCAAQQMNPWGWKTRPRDLTSPAPDDAVRIFSPPAPSPGMQYEYGEPIYYPTPQESWDCAFQLTTYAWQEFVKWSQPPTPYVPDDAIYGWDEASRCGGPQLTADDFVCTDDKPLTGIRWWGSFLGWGHHTPPYMPQHFHISIWTDVPATGDPPFSHPGTVIWDYVCDSYRWNFVGWDFDPRNNAAGIPNPPEACFEFECDIPESAWFWQDAQPTIYWVSISACDPTTPQYLWGWKTRPRDPASLAPDDAVAIWDPLFPVPGVVFRAGGALWYPTPADSWDTAFQWFTLPTPPDYTEPKWQQPPHAAGTGFDSASDLWMHETGVSYPKWDQPPSVNAPGLHVSMPLTIADDWICRGGLVTDIHWFGNYEIDDAGNEMRGAGIQAFRLSIHANQPVAPWGLPGALLWQLNVPFVSLVEQNTGLVNLEGSPIYRYNFDLPAPFTQTAGDTYWLDISVIPNPIGTPPQWRWQEADRSFPPIVSPAAITSDLANWSWISWPIEQFSNMAFVITSGDPPPGELDRVVADDFVSDGRDILALRWWGSYFDSRYEPGVGTDPQHVVDGWLLTIHWADANATPHVPPDLALDGHPTALAVYFAPAEAVEIRRVRGYDCLGHQIYTYRVRLRDCCLVCTESDPRNAYPPPGLPTAFQEIAGNRYWLSVQAVTGVEWLPTQCAETFTGHLPPLESGLPAHFWGWHTGTEPPATPRPMDVAAAGSIVSFLAYPPNCWDYGGWAAAPWECPTAPQRVDMAYELRASDCPLDFNGSRAIDLGDLTYFLSHFGYCYGQAGFVPECDLDNDGCIGLVDLTNFLSGFGTLCP